MMPPYPVACGRDCADSRPAGPDNGAECCRGLRPDDQPLATGERDLHATVGAGTAGSIIGPGSAMIVSGTNVTAPAAPLDAAIAAGRRQVNSMLAFRPQRRATSDSDAPGANVSATIRRFSAADHSRRPP